MSENEKISMPYSLGLIHGTENVLRRILSSINQRSPIISGKLIVHFAQLLGTLNDTEIIKENGKFIIDSRGDVVFDWIPEKRDAITHLIKTEG